MDGKRESWSRSAEYLLAMTGYAVGLGNVWRFPYLCFRSGGGAFLIPFFIMLALCGIPLLYMEMAVGQYTHQGPIRAFAKLCPFFKVTRDFSKCLNGRRYIGNNFLTCMDYPGVYHVSNVCWIATVFISFLFSTYYNVIITWSFYYLFSSFMSKLPWSDCSNEWNSPNCFDGNNRTIVDIVSNLTIVLQRANKTLSPTEDFYERSLLNKTNGIDKPGLLKWDLSLLLMMCWILVYFCIWKGPKLTGKVVYFTALFPYVVLFILLVRGFTLPGAINGIFYFIVPRWELLLDAKVWVNAAAQTFNSLGIAFGSVITFSSYQVRKNKILKDVLIIGLVDAFTCILAGFAIFSILGYLAHNQQKDVVDVITEGPGLVFVIYPESFTSMPVSQLISALFFFMLVCLGIDSQFASVEVIVTTIQDHFSVQVKKYLKRKEILVFVVCIISYLCGLPNVIQGGIYFFQLIDYYAATMSLMYLAFFEVIAITWFYGARRLARNVQMMTGVPPSMFFIICWYFISPVLIFGVWMFSLVQYQPFSVAHYEYPTWAIVLGWLIATMSIIGIPVGMIHSVCTSPGDTLLQKFLNSLKPCTNDIDDEIEHDKSIEMESKENGKLLPLHNGFIENGDIIVVKLQD